MNGYNEFSIRDILSDITARHWPEQLSPDFNRPARPAYLNLPEFQVEAFTRDQLRPLPIIEAGDKKDWSARPAAPDLPPKDWSKLSR